MTLTPVESSHVAAIGYLEAERVLLVRYRDGTLYAIVGWQPRDYELLMGAPSKGRFLQNVVIGKPILLSKGDNAVNPSTPEQPGPPSTSGPLNVIDEDADKCCRVAMTHFNASKLSEVSLAPGWKFVCPQCHQEFVPEMVGAVRHWRIVPQVHIVRK